MKPLSRCSLSGLPDRRQFLGRGILAAGTLALTGSVSALTSGPSLAAGSPAGGRHAVLRSRGGEEVQGRLFLPRSRPAPTVIMLPEWWGMTESVLARAAELSREGYCVLVVDPLRGQTAGSAIEARQLLGQVSDAFLRDILLSWVEWLTLHPDCRRPLTAIGWGWGGAVALALARWTRLSGVVVYYARVPLDRAALTDLSLPVLGHFARADKWITEIRVTGFAEGLKSLGHKPEIYWYQADHGFANPAAARHDSEDAHLARKRTLAFLQRVRR